jgi:hypothetical protein
VLVGHPGRPDDAGSKALGHDEPVVKMNRVTNANERSDKLIDLTGARQLDYGSTACLSAVRGGSVRLH